MVHHFYPDTVWMKRPDGPHRYRIRVWESWTKNIMNTTARDEVESFYFCVIFHILQLFWKCNYYFFFFPDYRSCDVFIRLTRRLKHKEELSSHCCCCVPQPSRHRFRSSTTGRTLLDSASHCLAFSFPSTSRVLRMTSKRNNEQPTQPVWFHVARWKKYGRVVNTTMPIANFTLSFTVKPITAKSELFANAMPAI